MIHQLEKVLSVLRDFEQEESGDHKELYEIKFILESRRYLHSKVPVSKSIHMQSTVFELPDYLFGNMARMDKLLFQKLLFMARDHYCIC